MCTGEGAFFVCLCEGVGVGVCVCVREREREREREGYEREVEWGRDLTREQQMNICFGGFFLQFFEKKQVALC